MKVPFPLVLAALGARPDSAAARALLAALLAPPTRRTLESGQLESWVWRDAGVELVFDRKLGFKSAFVAAPSSLQEVPGLGGDESTLEQVQERLGPPSVSGENWIRYDTTSHKLHFSSAAGTIDRATVMLPALPVTAPNRDVFAPYRAATRKELQAQLGAPLRTFPDAPGREEGIEVAAFAFSGGQVRCTILATLEAGISRGPSRGYEFVTFVAPDADERTLGAAADMLRIPGGLQRFDSYAFRAQSSVKWGKKLFATGALEYVALLAPPWDLLGRSVEVSGPLLWVFPITRSEYGRVRKGDFALLQGQLRDPARVVVELARGDLI